MADKIPLQDLLNKIENAKVSIPSASKWQHYKGDVYTVIGFVIREHDSVLCVVYEPDKCPGVHFARPVSVWTNKVMHNGIRTVRFTRI